MDIQIQTRKISVQFEGKLTRNIKQQSCRKTFSRYLYFLVLSSFAKRLYATSHLQLCTTLLLVPLSLLLMKKNTISVFRREACILLILDVIGPCLK